MRRTGKGRRWQRVRALVLARQPICPDPFGLHRGRVVPAEEVDHIVPHRGDRALFWDAANLQALCRECHTEKTRRENPSRKKQADKKMLQENQPPENHSRGKMFVMGEQQHQGRGSASHRVTLDVRALVAAMTGEQQAEPDAMPSPPRRVLYEIADLMIEAALPRLARERWLEIAVIPYSAATARQAKKIASERVSIARPVQAWNTR